MNPKRYFLSWMVMIALLLAACNSGATPATPEATPAEQVAATDEPAAVPTPTPAAPDPITVVQSFFAALNDNDLDAAVALLADDVRWRGVPTLSGKSSVQIALLADINSAVTNEISDLRVTRGRVTYTIAYFRNGALEIRGEDTATVQDGLITIIESYAFMGSDARPDIAEVSFTADDSAFDGPAEIAAGWVKVHLANEGQEPHHIQLVRLETGKTLADLEAALTANPESYPAWAEPFGGPNAPDPGSSLSATVYLLAGNYALIDLIPNAEGVPHFQSGLAKELLVTDPPSLMPGEPLPGLTVNLADFNFELSGAPAAGEQTIRFANQGGQPHEAYLVRLADGKTAGDYLNTPPGEIPPGAAVGGITGIVPGDGQYIQANLEPGNYALFCFLTDPASHEPHFVKGMIAEFTIP